MLTFKISLGVLVECSQTEDTVYIVLLLSWILVSSLSEILTHVKVLYIFQWYLDNTLNETCMVICDTIKSRYQILGISWQFTISMNKNVLIVSLWKEWSGPSFILTLWISLAIDMFKIWWFSPSKVYKFVLLFDTGISYTTYFIKVTVVVYIL